MYHSSKFSGERARDSDRPHPTTFPFFLSPTNAMSNYLCVDTSETQKFLAVTVDTYESITLRPPYDVISTLV